jgi:hypothetical protein
MTRFAATSILVLLTSFAIPALSAELPLRKPGLWEVQTSFENAKVPAQLIQQCIDAATDQMMQSRAGINSQRECSKRDVQKSAGSTTIDSTCTIGGRTRTSHVVITGSFDSAYTMTVTSQSDSTPASRTITMAAKWIGPCTADQKPGDIIMANGRKINIMDAQKLITPPGVPQPPR